MEVHHCNQYSALLQDVDNGGCYACMGMGVSGEPLYLPLSFAMNLKLF